MRTITKDKLEQTLAQRINESEAELEALQRVKINTTHKTLTNRAVENGRIGDYIGIGKSLKVSYQSYHRYLTFDLIAYTYTDANGAEIGSDGFTRVNRTMTPLELKAELDKVIAGRVESLKALKVDLVNAGKFVKQYNAIVEKHNALLEGVTWATREVTR